MSFSCHHLCSSEMNRHTCMNCILKNFSLLNELNYDELSILEEKRYTVSYSKGEMIYKEGTPARELLCLNSGKVKICKKGVNGNEQIVDLKKPVDFIGFTAFMYSGNHSTSAYAIDDCSVCFINKAAFDKVVNQNKELSNKIIELLARQLNRANNRLVNLTQKHMRGRIAEALLLLGNVYGISDDGQSLNIQLKRSDLASLSNMTTANAIRTLSSFVKEGIVWVNRRNIKILNPKALECISRFGW